MNTKSQMIESQVAYRIYTPDTANYGWIGSKQYDSYEAANMTLWGADAKVSKVVAVPMVANPRYERVRIASLIVSVEPDEVTTADIESLLTSARMHNDASMAEQCMDALRPAQEGCVWHGTHYQGVCLGADKARHAVEKFIKATRRELYYDELVREAAEG